MEILYYFRAHRVHDVANQGNRCRDGDSLIDEGKIVSARILAWCLARLFHSQHVIAALGKTHEEGDEEGHHKIILRDRITQFIVLAWLLSFLILIYIV